jgi:hypothetical protein
MRVGLPATEAQDVEPLGRDGSTDRAPDAVDDRLEPQVFVL